MQTDPTEPWGVTLDYAGRIRQPIIEQGLAVDLAVQDSQPGWRDTPTITASITVVSPDGEAAFTLAQTTVYAYPPNRQWQPDPQKVKQAVEQCAALAVQRLAWLATLAPTPTI
ncbi:hypothetical protein AB0O31_03120 [Kitasatospora cineracea]|uniref:hypothetical protein n=1 Tax=Kitasatospora cineracea TaxID=88074 RepID=UPI00343BC2E2